MKKYGLVFGSDADALKIEMHMIRAGGKWTEKGREVGLGLSHHYEEMRKILWPRLDSHRWHVLCRDSILSEPICVLMGPASSSKTHSAAWIYLCDYLCHPENTLVLVSSTTIQALRLRVWGEIVGLWQEAISKYDYLPGHMLESRGAICTDSLEDGDFESRSVRDMRRGVVMVPTVVGGKFVGLAKWIGIKQQRVRVIGDELPHMGVSFLSSFSNLRQNASFRAVLLGNPNDPLDPLGVAAEPIDGWSSHLEPKKTATWRTKFMNGFCVNLVGSDSPNFDLPGKAKFPYLISQEKIDEVSKTFGENSYEVYSQCKGVMKSGMLLRRVITRDACRQFGASKPVIWKGDATTKIGGMDAAYGGDRCVCGHIEFGPDVDGKIVILIHPPVIVPISVASDLIPEDQIAKYVKDYCVAHEILAENFFHDSTGRGTLGTSLARVWSSQCNPVEFGGSPTERPVSLDIYVTDEKTNTRRLKTCKEHYSKFVTELWFSVAYAIQASQVRGLPEEIMDEGCMREWNNVAGNKKELESKAEMKERIRRSPDLFDWLAICVEGARRRGFQISKLSNSAGAANSTAWVNRLRDKQRQLRNAHALDHAA